MVTLKASRMQSSRGLSRPRPLPVTHHGSLISPHCCIVPDLLLPSSFLLFQLPSIHPSLPSSISSNKHSQTYNNHFYLNEYSFVRYHIHQQRVSTCCIQEPLTPNFSIMSTDAAPTPLSKVDSAVQGLSSSPPKDEAPSKHRRASSTAAPGVFNINDLGSLSPLIPIPGSTGHPYLLPTER